MLFFRIMVGVVLPLLVALIPEQQSSNTLDPGAATDMAIAGELKMLEVCSIDLADACKSAPSAVMLFAVGRRCVPAGCFRFDASSAGATAIVEQGEPAAVLRVAAIRIIAARLAEQAPGVSVEEFLGLQAAAFKKLSRANEHAIAKVLSKNDKLDLRALRELLEEAETAGYSNGARGKAQGLLSSAADQADIQEPLLGVLVDGKDERDGGVKDRVEQPGGEKLVIVGLEKKKNESQRKDKKNTTKAHEISLPACGGWYLWAMGVSIVLLMLVQIHEASVGEWPINAATWKTLAGRTSTWLMLKRLRSFANNKRPIRVMLAMELAETSSAR